MRGDYSNGRIYFIEPICEHEDNEFYFGSTLQKLCKRMDFHRGSYKRWKNGKSTKVMCYELFEKYGLENCKIYLVELYPCKSKEELESKEGYYIRNYNCINKVIPDRTRKEWCINNKDKLREYHKKYKIANKERIDKICKEYYNDNKVKIVEYKKVYYQSHKDSIVEKNKEYYNDNKEKIIKQHKEYSKEYRKLNRDKLKEKNKEYYELNIEKIKEKHECECGGKYTCKNKSKHLKTKKHILYKENQTKDY